MFRYTPETMGRAIDIIKASPTCKGKRQTYYSVPIAFDTETTSIMDPDGTRGSFVYIWMLKVGDLSLYGRDISEFGEVLDHIGAALDGKRIIVYVHNLGYDIEFISHLLTIADQLNANSHEPIYLLDDRGIEFRDSMILSGGLSLETIGKNLRSHEFKKKVGYLDYRKVRHPDTPLSPEELEYCEGDVDVLNAYIAEEIARYGNVAKIPYTNTGRVRKDLNTSIFNNKNFRVDYRLLMKTCIMKPEVYEYCRRAFMGGFTHANIKYVGKVIKDVVSYDLNSSYPSVMLYRKYPMGEPRIVNGEGAVDIINDRKKLSIWRVTFHNMERKPGIGDTFLSWSRRGDPDIRGAYNLKQMNNDNGRIWAAGQVTMYLTNVDLMLCSLCYDWEDLEIHSGVVWDHISYLPYPLISRALYYYKNKTSLKGIKEELENYAVCKASLNSFYGCCVTNPVKDEIKFTGDDWIHHTLTDEEKIAKIEKENDRMGRFLYYPWGVFVTAYARWNLWTAIIALGDDYIYADTDSIKVKASSTKLKEYLEKYNESLHAQMSHLLRYDARITEDDLKPVTPGGKVKFLGEWDYEGSYDKFKTLGAKRYLMESNDGKIHATVAGIDPSKLEIFLMKTNDPFGKFREGLTVPPDQTGHLYPHYVGYTGIVKDYKDVEYYVKQPHGIHLEPSEWSLTIPGSFKNLLKVINCDL